MDVVTFETAIKLKKAGFPQPKTAFGQVWYFEESGARLLILKGGANSNYVMDGALLVFKDYIKDMPIVYAPTAPDILPKLEHPDPTVDFFLFWSDDLFSVIRAYWMDASGNIGEHANPAEACAAAWLELKKEQV